MMMKTWFTALSLSLAGTAFAATPAMEKDGMLVDANGMTLYTYSKDASGMSACNGKCAENWPPLSATASDKASDHWSVIKRDDSTLQWAYNGQALYTFAMDKKAGETTGDGKGGNWKIAKP